MCMTKTEYQTAIKANLTTAEALCVELRNLRGLKKLAASISVENLVAVDVLDKSVADKESELKKIRCELGKARRIVAKLEAIEAIEAEDGTPKDKKPTNKKTVVKKSEDVPSVEKATAPAPSKVKNTGKLLTGVSV